MIASLTCEECGAPYPPDSPRVMKAATTKTESDLGAAKLCWVCARLYRSSEAEAKEEK
jgi:hypothetical protein